VVAIGATSAQSVFGKITPIDKRRGGPIDLDDGIKALATVHPSRPLREPSDLICPAGGVRDFVSSPPAKNISLLDLVETAIERMGPASITEGRFAVVTNVGCGMRWTRAALSTSARLADGEVVWS
jgi:hypothetical protein